MFVINFNVIEIVSVYCFIKSYLFLMVFNEEGFILLLKFTGQQYLIGSTKRTKLTHKKKTLTVVKCLELSLLLSKLEVRG